MLQELLQKALALLFCSCILSGTFFTRPRLKRKFFFEKRKKAVDPRSGFDNFSPLQRATPTEK
jgi:hypothetical protein